MTKKIIDLNWTIEYVKDLKWVNEEKTLIECVVKFDVHDEELAFGVDPNDFYQHSIDLWERANAGEYGPIAEPRKKTEIEKLIQDYKNQFEGDFSLNKI